MSDIRSDRSSSVGPLGSQPSVTESHVNPITVDYDYLQTHSPWFLESLGDPSPEKRRGSVTVVICRVCSSKIPLLGYDLDEHYIVKCSHCKEATPIRPAPPGERYIRCVCNCLLICRETATKVACPRLNCQRIITLRYDPKNLHHEPESTATHAPQGTCRLTCAHCLQPFIFNMRSKSVTKCPYCDRISAINGNYRNKEMHISIALATLYTVVVLLMVIGNSIVNDRFEGEISLYVILFAITGIAWIRPLVAYRVRGSAVEGEI